MAVKRQSGKAKSGTKKPTAKQPPAKKPRPRSATMALRGPRRTVPRAGETQTFIREIDAELDGLKQRLAELSRRAEQPVDEYAQVFADEVRSLVGEAGPDEAAVRRAARVAVAEQAWTQRLGTLLDTSDVVALLSVSKQRVSTLARDHRLIALPQGGRLRFPAWQFATGTPADRECIAEAHGTLIEQGVVSPWTAASWFRERHPELDGKDPIAFLRAGGDRSRLLDVAQRDAARLAQ